MTKAIEKSNNSTIFMSDFSKKKSEIKVPFLPKGYEKNIQKYIKEGLKSKYRNKKFEKILRKTQAELRMSLIDKMRNLGYSPTIKSGYIYCEGDIPIMLIAHMDTVHAEIPRDIIYKDNFMTSPQGIGGDDRCGIYAILEIIKELKCHVLFTEDEEIGAKGARNFANSKIAKKLEGKIKYCIEIDRRGDKDAVFYECDNKEFIDFIESTGYFEQEYGTFTDICYVAPALDCSAVNLSSGYYKEHTKSEYIDLQVLDEIIYQAKEIIKSDCERFEWVEFSYPKFFGAGKYYDDGWYSWEDYYNDYGEYPPAYNEKVFDILWGKNKDLKCEEVFAISEAEAVGKFLMYHTDLTYLDIECYEI